MRPHTPWLALDASTSKVVELGASRLLFGTLGSVVSGQGFVGGDQWPHAGGGYLGDNMAAISIIQNPDGPWRTRHLRLRASVLKERLQEGSWRIFHLDGKRLIADVFTKAIVDKNVCMELVQALRSLSGSRKGNARDGGCGGGDGGRDGGEEQGEDGGRSDQGGEAGTMHGWLRCSDVLADNNKGGFGGIFGDWHGLRSEE